MKELFLVVLQRQREPPPAFPGWSHLTWRASSVSWNALRLGRITPNKRTRQFSDNSSDQDSLAAGLHSFLTPALLIVFGQGIVTSSQA